MLKMQDIYKQNAKLGDPTTIEKQLDENAQKLDRLRQEIRKFEV
jgi:formin-binding protein 1